MGAPNNPRAFPSSAIDDRYGGMSLWDYFAGQALPSIMHLCAKDTLIHGESIEASFARKAYQIADAMLAERAKRLIQSREDRLESAALSLRVAGHMDDAAYHRLIGRIRAQARVMEAAGA